MQQGHQVGDDAVDHAGRRHQPERPGRRELSDELLQGRGATRLAAGLFLDALLRLLDDLGAPIVDHELVPGLGEPDDHVLSHPPQADHSELHGEAPF